MHGRLASLVLVALLGARCVAALRHQQHAGDGDEVSLMINCIEADAEILEFKVSHLVNMTNFDHFKRRILVLDTHGAEPSITLAMAATRVLERGLMDESRVVDYSPEYIEKAKERLGWKRQATNPSRQGNLVYFFMLDSSPTRYLVHYDLDMVMWSAPGYSWVTEGLALLKSDPNTFYATSPRVGSSGSPTKNRTCESKGPGATWVAMRNFLMDVPRVWEVLSSFKDLHPTAFYVCGLRTLEKLIGCSICEKQPEFADFQRIDIMDSRKQWVLHFPSLTRCGLDIATWVMRNMIEQNIAVAAGPGFAAQHVHFWLDEGRRRAIERARAKTPWKDENELRAAAMEEEGIPVCTGPRRKAYMEYLSLEGVLR